MKVRTQRVYLATDKRRLSHPILVSLVLGLGLGAVLVLGLRVAQAASPARPAPYLVTDINTKQSSSYPYLVSVSDTLFFRANDGSTGNELWKSDGTEAGTVRVRDIYTGSNSSSPTDLTNVNGTLFFSAMGASSSGWELWKSDGAEAGTVRVRDIYTGSGSSDPSYLANVNARSSSGPTTATAERSCGRPTARRRARCESQTSTPEATAQARTPWST